MKKNFFGSFPAKGFTGTAIKKVCNGIHIILSDLSKRGAFWEKLTKQTIEILIGSPLPRRMWVCKVNLTVEKL